MPTIEQRPPVAGSDGWPWPDGMHRVLRQVLSRRPIASPEDLGLELARLVPVGRFGSLSAAVELLHRHRDGSIVIVGDFDADGATSSALMFLCLSQLGFPRVSYFVPDRFELGYGLSPAVIERIRERAPTLIVTVDNGISSVDGVAAARALGIDVLITDHHLPPQRLPAATAIVNPNLPGDAFPGKHLAGVGVAFYLLAALGRALGRPGLVAGYLDLVALGTMADLVPLDQGNRILIKQGLDRIRAGRCLPGIAALCDVAGVALRDVCDATLAYQLAPRLNAAGRLADMSIGVRCLVTTSASEARALAATLDELNRERRGMEQKMRAQALELVDAHPLLAREGLPNVVCLFHPDWHEGLVGLIASRVKERLHRPALAFARASDGRLKGSGRSVPGFHLRDALADVDAARPGLIERFGGHAMAAGLTLLEDALPDFQAVIEQLGNERVGPELLCERILTDGELAAEDLTLEVAWLLQRAGPWGQGFPEPCFEGSFTVASARRLKEAHLKMAVQPLGGDRTIDAIAFNQAEIDVPAGECLRLVYRLAVNDYAREPTLQLVVEHIADGARPARQAC